MRTILNNIGKYIKRLYQAIFNITPKVKIIEKESNTLEQIGFSKKRDFNDFDIETIRKLMEMTKGGDFDEDDGVKLLIENRKQINEYKKWYVKLIGYNKPTGDLKEMINNDLSLDRITMDMKLKKFLIKESKKKAKIVNKPTEYPDLQVNNSTREEKIINSNLPDVIKQAMIDNPIENLSIPKSISNGRNKIDFAKLLEINKENLNRIK